MIPVIATGPAIAPKPNTVHLTIWIASARLIGGRARSVLRRIGKLLILRLTPRGLRWFRLETTRSCRISASTARWNAARCFGGEGAEGGQFAAHDAHGVQEREPVGILVGLQGG